LGIKGSIANIAVSEALRVDAATGALDDASPGGSDMKAPSFTVLTPLGWGWRSHEVAADMIRQDMGPKGWRQAWRTVLAERCAVPRVAIHVEESLPFRAIGGDSGWFVIRGVSEPVYNLGCGSVKVFLIGFLETKRMMGLKKNVEGCVSDSDTGFYLTYPKDLIEFVLAMAAEDVPHAGLRSVEPIVAERIPATTGEDNQYLFQQAMRNLTEVWGRFFEMTGASEPTASP
jgi:hypothetical protein